MEDRPGALGFGFALLCAATDWVADAGGNPYQTHWGFLLAVAGECFYFSILVVAVTAVKGRRGNWIGYTSSRLNARGHWNGKSCGRASANNSASGAICMTASVRNSPPSAMGRPFWPMTCARTGARKQPRPSISAN